VEENDEDAETPKNVEDAFKRRIRAAKTGR
jgi:hypothetical protein